MTIDEMFNELEDKARDTFIVTLKYKYDFEENYTIENHILEYDSLDDSYVWLNDWYEGQTDVEVLGYMLLGDVDTTKLLTCEDCRNCKRWDECPCGKEGHTNGTSIGYSIGECKDYEPSITPSFEEWLASFNTESATECFTAVQELKEKLNGQMD